MDRHHVVPGRGERNTRLVNLQGIADGRDLQSLQTTGRGSSFSYIFDLSILTSERIVTSKVMKNIDHILSSHLLCKQHANIVQIQPEQRPFSRHQDQGLEATCTSGVQYGVFLFVYIFGKKKEESRRRPVECDVV